MSPYSVVGVPICSGLDGPVVESRYWQEIFLFSQKFTRALEHPQRPVQWVPELFPWDKKAGGVKLITHLQLVLWLRTSGALTLPLLYTFITIET